MTHDGPWTKSIGENSPNLLNIYSDTVQIDAYF